MIRMDMSKLKAAKAKFAKMQERKVLETTKKITLDVYRRVVEGSPVDTGAFRGAWEIEPPTKAGEPGRVSNATPYGPDLANGGSTQAADGWIENACEASARSRGGA